MAGDAKPDKPEPITVQLERQQRQAILRKVQRGEKLTQSEMALLRKHEKEQEESRRWEYYESIPQKHWRMMSGRQAKILNEQATRYGIPFSGKTISLPAVVRALHEFLAKHCNHISLEDGAAPNGKSPALERFREKRAEKAEIELRQMERELVPVGQMREALARIAQGLRSATDQIQRQYGNGAAELLRDALEDAERDIEIMFGGDNGNGDSQ